MLQFANPTLEAMVTTTTEAAPTCSMSRLDYCKYQNNTVYPNVFGHRNQYEVLEDLVRFRYTKPLNFAFLLCLQKYLKNRTRRIY